MTPIARTIDGRGQNRRRDVRALSYPLRHIIGVDEELSRAEWNASPAVPLASLRRKAAETWER